MKRPLREIVSVLLLAACCVALWFGPPPRAQASQEGVATRARVISVDNSMLEMRFLAEYSKESGFVSVSDNLPSWFKTHVLNG